ncbi:MAG: MurR/RpiR family transcriptional regulator [Anaerovoracaceae bacterium]
MSTTIRELIKTKYSLFSKKEQQIANYVLENYQQSMLLSSSELAHIANVSDTTVVRFAKTLGFAGFYEYKSTIKKEYVPTQKVYASLASLEEERSKDSTLLSWYFKGITNDFISFLNSISLSNLDKMADAVINSETVYLFGVGSDEVVVHFLKNYLTVMGIKCIAITQDGLALKESFFFLNDKDSVIMCAYPTLQDSELWVANHTKRTGARLLLLTDSEITTRKFSPYASIEVKDGPETFFNSYVLQLMFCNALLLRIYEKNTEITTKAMKDYQDMLSE